MVSCKKRAREEITALPKIYDEEFAELKNAGLDFVTKVLLFAAKKSSWYRQRNAAYGFSSFLKRDDVTLSEKFGDFLILDDKSGDNPCCC